MKTPPWVSSFIGDDEKMPNRYLYGDKVLFGFPNRTYFELYTGTCSSDKIYSVQTKDFPKDIAAVVYYPEDNVNVDVEKLANGAQKGKQHVLVECTADLSNLLESRGVKSNGASFVNPSAFAWVRADEVEIDDLPEDNQPIETKETKSNKKVIIAASIAALSLLN